MLIAIGLLAALALTSAVNGAAPASARATAAAAGAAPAPTGLSPSSGSVNANPVFSWSAARGATGYDVELATDPSFNDVITLQSQVNRQFTPTSQLPMTKIYWRVRSQDNGTTSRWSSTASFTRTKLAGPTLVAPASGTTLVPPSQAPLLQWKAVNGAVKYHVYVDDAPDFLGAQVFDVATTSLVEPEPQDAGTYYWRVTAEIASGLLTNPSATRSYVVGSLGAITGASPDVDSSGSIPQVEQVVLSWNPLPGAVSYDLRVSTDVNFPDDEIIDQRTVYGTRYSPAKTYNVDDYYWQVRPRNTFGKAKDWDQVPVHRFSRTYFDTDNAATGTKAVPTLSNPANVLNPPVTTDFYYQWTPARLASSYRLDLGTDPNFSPGTFNSCFTTQTTYVPGINTDACLPLVGVRYYWRVKALDTPGNAIEGRYSETHQFVYSQPFITQTSPANGATVTVPTLTWDVGTQAVRYHVTITGNDGSTVTADTYSNSYTPTGLLDPAKSPYRWFVQGIDSKNRATPLPIVENGPTFTLAASPTATASTPVPTSPAPGATASPRFPSLTWTPVAGAKGYRVWIGPAGSGFLAPIDGTWSYPAATDVSDKNISAGNYDWFVQALNDSGGVISSGPTSTFTIADLGPVTGQQVALDGSGFLSGAQPCTKSLSAGSSNTCSNLRQTPTLDWAPLPGAGYYLVYLSHDAMFQNILSTDATTQSRWTAPAALPDSQAGVAYYWFVRACKAPNNCAPLTTATNAFDKLSTPVVGLTTAATDGNDITFSWQDYLQTNQAVSDPATGEHPDQAAQAYRVQVSTTPSFTNLIDNQVVDQTTYTAYDRLYPEGPLYWRVQAIDGSNNALPFSAAKSFTKSSPVPQIISPAVTSNAATSHLTETGPFRWTATPFAANYDVQVFKNADTTASPANQVSLPNGNVKQSAATFDRPLATGTTYVWRVRRLDASNNPGRWSSWGAFKITGKAPTQAKPANKARVSATSSLFTWSAVPGAASYRFERRLAGTSSDTDSVDTVSTAWAFPSPMQSGAFEWRVSSLDAVGQVIASSPWRKFHVDATAPTVLKVSPQSPFSASADIAITFSEKIKGAGARTIQLLKDGTKTPIPMKVTTRGSKVILNPKSNLKKATTYDLVIKGGIRDTSGLPLQPVSFQIGTK